MPRDLLADKKALDGMPELSRESASGSQREEESAPMPAYNSSIFVEERFKKMKEVHPFGALLNCEDLDDCDWLEHAAFDPIEAASREKVSDCRVFSFLSTASSLASSQCLHFHGSHGRTIGLLSGAGHAPSSMALLVGSPLQMPQTLCNCATRQRLSRIMYASNSPVSDVNDRQTHAEWRRVHWQSTSASHDLHFPFRVFV